MIQVNKITVAYTKEQIEIGHVYIETEQTYYVGHNVGNDRNVFRRRRANLVSNKLFII